MNFQKLILRLIFQDSWPGRAMSTAVVFPPWVSYIGLWNTDSGFGLFLSLLCCSWLQWCFSVSILKGRTLTSSFALICSLRFWYPGEHVTSRFKNEVERMGFDMNNAWRISNINEKYKWVVWAADSQPNSISNHQFCYSTLLELLPSSAAPNKGHSEWGFSVVL